MPKRGRYGLRSAVRLGRSAFGKTRSGAMFRGAAAGFLASRGKKRRGGSATVTRRVKRKTQSDRAGTQWTRSYKKTGRIPKLMTRIRQQNSMNLNKLTTRIRIVKSFDNNGAVPLNKDPTNVDLMMLPTFIMPLNAQNPNGASTFFPVRQLSVVRTGVDDGRFRWQGVQTMNAAGATASDSWLSHEYGPASSGWKSLRSMYWLGSQIKLNLWGAKSKPVRYTIDVCSVADNRVSPFVATVGSNVNIETQQDLESMTKQYLFNPISSLEWAHKNDFKILRTFDHTIQPPQTVDGDSDPLCHTLTWNMRFGRVVTFEDFNVSGLDQTRQNNDTNFTTAAEVNVNVKPVNSFPTEKSIVFLMIRATDFSDAAVFSNTIHGSFDFDVRSYWRYNALPL